MKVLLANSPLRYYMTTSFLHPDWPALNLPQLAAMIQYKHEVRVLDNWRGWFGGDPISRELKKFQPDVLALSNSIEADTNEILSWSREVRKENPNLFMISGGQAATLHFRELLKNGFNAIVLGEGELTFQEIIAGLDKKKLALEEIAGVAYIQKGECVTSAERPLIKDLDNLPFPAWELMPRLKSKFFSNIYSSAIETSRGCPFGCEFCAVQSFWKRSHRKKSNARILEELKYLKFKLGYEQIYFVDDAFALNIREYTELFEAMISQRVFVRGFAQIRPDTIAENPEMIKLAAQAGFWGFLVGFESYSDEELAIIGKVGTREINIRAAEILRQNNVGIYGVHMFGTPGFNRKRFAETFKIGIRYSDTFRLSRFSPLPGTPVYKKLAADGMIENRRDRLVPYAHRLKTEKDQWMDALYYWYEFKSLFSFTALKKLYRSRGATRRLELRSYLVAFRYVIYLLFRKIGIKIL